MKFELKTYNRNAPDVDLIEDLIKVANEIGVDKITIEKYNEKGNYSASTLILRFGGWNNALEKAGLNKTKNHNISIEDLLKNIEEVWIKLGKQPSHSQMTTPLSKYGSTTYVRRFGTWQNALNEFIKFINAELDSFENDKNSDENVQSNNLSEIIFRKHKTKRDINWRLRFLVMRRDNFKCIKCGRSPATHVGVILHIDHKEAWSEGGETVFENLQTLCQECNIGKSNLNDREA